MKRYSLIYTTSDLTISARFSVNQEYSTITGYESLSAINSSVDEIYRAIGEYSVRFEHISLCMQQGIAMLLVRGGLRDQSLANVVVADLTAYPLKSILQSLLAESLAMNANEKKICEKIFSMVTKVIERRNNIIHAAWFVGWGEPDPSNIRGVRLSKGREGAITKSHEFSISDFDAHSAECREVESLIRALWGLVVAGIPIEECMSLNKNGEVSLKTTGA